MDTLLLYKEEDLREALRINKGLTEQIGELSRQNQAQTAPEKVSDESDPKESPEEQPQKNTGLVSVTNPPSFSETETEERPASPTAAPLAKKKTAAQATAVTGPQPLP